MSDPFRLLDRYAEALLTWLEEQAIDWPELRVRATVSAKSSLPLSVVPNLRRKCR